MKRKTVRPEAQRMPRPPGVAEGWDAISVTEGGVLRATCGVCGITEDIVVRPHPRRHGARVIAERALRRAGWLFRPPYDWVEKDCLKRLRRAIAAGHVQIPMFR